MNRKRKWRRVLITIFVAFLVPVVVFFWLNLQLSVELNKRLKRIRSVGEPITLNELNEFYATVPANLNAANVYTQAFNLIEKSRSHIFLENLDGLPLNSEPLPEDLRKAMAAAVAENQSTFAALEKTAMFKDCRYPVDYAPGWGCLLPHLKQLSQCGNLFLCRGVLHEQSGDVDASLESVVAIRRCATSLDSEPDLVSVLVQHKLDFQASELLRWLLNRRQMSQAQLSRLQQVFEKQERTNWVDRAVIGDRCMCFGMFDSVNDFLGGPALGNDGDIGKLGFQLLRLTGRLKKDEIIFLDKLEQCRDAHRMSFPGRLDRIEEIESKTGQETRSGFYFVTGRILPGLLKSFVRDAQNVARLRLVQTALAIEKFRLVEGRLPPTLEELTPIYLPHIPLDPFDGEELRYRRRDKGYLLYSIGPDRFDDDAAKAITRNPKVADLKGDMVFSVAR